MGANPTTPWRKPPQLESLKRVPTKKDAEKKLQKVPDVLRDQPGLHRLHLLQRLQGRLRAAS